MTWAVSQSFTFVSCTLSCSLPRSSLSLSLSISLSTKSEKILSWTPNHNHPSDGWLVLGPIGCLANGGRVHSPRYCIVHGQGGQCCTANQPVELFIFYTLLPPPTKLLFQFSRSKTQIMSLYSELSNLSSIVLYRSLPFPWRNTSSTVYLLSCVLYLYRTLSTLFFFAHCFKILSLPESFISFLSKVCIVLGLVDGKFLCYRTVFFLLFHSCRWPSRSMIFLSPLSHSLQI